MRVGVHLGDVAVQPNGDLLGHGVNVAARLMAQASPGSALVSADVRRTIRGAIGERLVSRGTVHLDKMAETIEAFVVVATSAVPPPARASGELTLAVLPFDNLSNDPELQFFSDGVAEEILQTITRASRVNVIGRTSAFQFRGERKGDAARVLKATHVLDGAVRRSGARMRVTAQLTEAASNRLLWTDRYDRSVADAFELQDDIAGQVTAALKQKLTPPSSTPAKIDPVAYDLYLQARSILSQGLMDQVAHAETLLTQAASRAPDAADIWALLARARAHLLPVDGEGEGEPGFEAACMAARHALALDRTCGEALVAQALMAPAFAKHAEKLSLMAAAYAHSPNDPLVAPAYAAVLQMVGRCQAALPLREHAMRLDPLSTLRASQYAGSLSAAGRIDESIAVSEETWARLPHDSGQRSMRLSMYIVGGRLDEAERMLNSSEFSSSVYKEASLQRQFVAVLRMPNDQREQAFRAASLQQANVPLSPDFCVYAAFAGCSDLAFGLLFDALDSGRSMTHLRIGTSLRSRALTVSSFFDMGFSRKLHEDIRFPRLCARVGLVAYWQSSGHWPDCAAYVPYDFKAECEKVAAGE